MARKTENALQKWEYPKKSGIHIREILNTTGGDAFGASYMVTVPAKLTGKLRERKQFTRREDAEDWADKTFLGYLAFPEGEISGFRQSGGARRGTVDDNWHCSVAHRPSSSPCDQMRSNSANPNIS